MGEEQFKIRYNLVFSDISKKRAKRTAFMKNLEGVVDEWIGLLDDEPISVASHPHQTVYETDIGLVSVTNYNNNYPQISVLEKMGCEWSPFSAGRLLASLIDAIRKKGFPTDIDTWYVHENGRLNVKRIRDLVAVNVRGQRGKTFECMNNYAIPLHYLNGKPIQESVTRISAVENAVISKLRRLGDGDEITIETATTRIWDLKRGTTEVYCDMERPFAGAELYRKESFKISEVVKRTAPNPQSDEAQSS